MAFLLVLRAFFPKTTLHVEERLFFIH